MEVFEVNKYRTSRSISQTDHSGSSVMEMIPGNCPDLAREQSYPSPFQNSTLLPLLLLSLASQKHTPDTATYIRKEYDYVIVGAGTAGSVVASRLSEIESVTVLLLEAGPPPPLLTEVPAIAGLFIGSDIDWYFLSEPQRYAGRLNRNGQIPFSSGKTIGGQSSSIHFSIYSRGSLQKYDEWEAQGAEGWNGNEAFRYFIKAEDNKDPEFLKNGYHGVGGPMTVETFVPEPMFSDPVIKAQKRFGYPCVDPNGPSQIGIADYQGNRRYGQRCSVAKGYLVPAENRTNLDIVAEAYVTKISMQGKRARGVHFDHKGNSYEVKAKREVILSAGAFNSPKLLMLSGIGPRNTLRKFNISLVQDLPVGLNLQTHAGPIAFFTGDSRIPTFLERLQDPRNIRKYLNTRKGVLAASEAVYGITYLKDDQASPPCDVPDYQVYYGEVAFQRVPIGLNVAPEVYNKYFRRYENGTNFSCYPLVLQTRSRGYVTLRSSDPYAYPVIQPNSLKDREDMRLAVSAIRECHEVLQTPEMRKLGLRPLSIGCEDFSGDEDEYFECLARAVLFLGIDPAGTAKMGDPSDSTTVLDPELRVKGIEGLRVVDSSIMPTIPTANLHNSVVMIAEKASEMIKKDIFIQRNIKPFDR